MLLLLDSRVKSSLESRVLKQITMRREIGKVVGMEEKTC